MNILYGVLGIAWAIVTGVLLIGGIGDGTWKTAWDASSEDPWERFGARHCYIIGITFSLLWPCVLLILFAGEIGSVIADVFATAREARALKEKKRIEAIDRQLADADRALRDLEAAPKRRRTDKQRPTHP